MPPATPALALIVLANATTPDRPLWNVTPLTPTDHIPRARLAHARPHISLHTLCVCTLLRGTPDRALQAMHCTPATAPRPGSWPVAPLSSSLDRATTEGSAFMVQALTILHPWCTPYKTRQQCPGRRCSEENWGPLWPTVPDEDRAPPSRKAREAQRTYCTERLTHNTNTWNTLLFTGAVMDNQQG